MKINLENKWIRGAIPALMIHRCYSVQYIAGLYLNNQLPIP